MRLALLLALVVLLSGCGPSWRAGSVLVEHPDGRGGAVLHLPLHFPPGVRCEWSARAFTGVPEAWRPVQCSVSHAGGFSLWCPEAAMVTWDCSTAPARKQAVPAPSPVGGGARNL